MPENIYLKNKKRCYAPLFICLDKHGQNVYNLYTVDAIENNKYPVCTVKMAMPHTALIEKIHETVEYRAFSPSEICLNSLGDGLYVKGLFDRIYRAYDSSYLLSECR